MSGTCKRPIPMLDNAGVETGVGSSPCGLPMPCVFHDAPSLTPEVEKRILDDVERACRHEKAQRKALIAAHASLGAAVWLTDNLEARKELRAVLAQVAEVL